MIPTNWLNLLLRRLSVLTKPLPLISTVGVLVLGVFVWEYFRHPEWFGTYSQEETSPTENGLPNLTPDEQAAIADIDTLEVLLNELGGADGTPSLQVLPEDSKDKTAGLADDLLTLSQPSSTTTTPEDNIFKKYLDQYQFLSSTSREAPIAPPSLGVVSTEARSDRSNSSLTRPFNPLAAALQGQSTLTGSTSETSPLATAVQAETGNTSTTPGEENINSNGAFFSTPNSTGVVVPGVPFPVLPTIPQMSPPPGTTGYTPPASLNLLPGTAGATPSTTSFPAAGTTSLSPGSAGVPNLPPVGSSPNLSTPQFNTGTSYVTPVTPVVPAPVIVSPTTPPPPFTGNRPIGGGNIGTFSNPSTFPQETSP
jgi:hypothetical protein